MGSKLLKEWAIVCKALGDGRQIFIARKGGISEAEGEFVVENREFFLLPTYLHQSADQLDPRYRAELELVGREEPRDGFLPIGLFARVTDELPILRPEPLRRLEHIWNPKLLEERFGWGAEKKLMLLVLRVYRLPEPIRLPMRPKYGGCKSWVTPETEIVVPKGLSPVLSDTEFARQREQLLRKIDEY